MGARHGRFVGHRQGICTGDRGNFVNGHIIGGYLIMKLTNNTILITGGTSGIGYELTKQLTALGNTILITGRDQANVVRQK